MKNICVFNGNMSRSGGTEKCTQVLANELCKRTDYNVIIADISNEQEKCFFDLESDIKIVHLHPKNVLYGIAELRRLIKRNRTDVIINVEAMLGIYSIPAVMFTKTKNIIWEHGNFFQKQCRTIDIVRWAEIKFCTNYITLTKRDKHNFMTHFKGRCAINHIYNPISMPDREIIYDIKSKKILTVGLVRHIKGFNMLIDVAQIVLNKHKDWIWEIYGYYDEQDEYVKQIFAKVQEYGIGDRLIFKGVTKNISERYEAGGIMVMTSFMEGLPMTLLEAKSYKLPIVSFDIETGPDEIIEDGVNGYLVKPYDTDEMAQKICEIIENDELRKKFSDNAYIGIEKFDIDGITKKWIDVIGE